MVARRSPFRAFAGRYVIALGSSFALVVVGIFGVNLAIDAKLDRIERVDLELPPEPGEAGNFLLLGSDTRAFVETEEEAEAFGTQEELGSNRSDTIMVVHVEPGQQRGLVVSFPRDLWVDIPDTGEAKINAAFNDGPQRVIDTLEANFGIPIHHYIEIDFESFRGIVDAIGTVPVFLSAPARDVETGLEAVAAGCYELNGAHALKYVRSRALEYYVDGEWQAADAIPDFGRIARQQDFMRRLATVAYKKGSRNPRVANDLANEVVGELKADDALSRGDVFALVNTFRVVDPNDPAALEMLTVPTERYLADDGQDALVAVEPDAEALFARLRTFEPPPTTVDVRPSEVQVRVLNGSGVDGAAAATLTSLEELGFMSAGKGNASATRLTQITHAPGNEAKARLVADTLGVGQLVADPSVVDADVVVVLGADFEPITEGDPATSAPAPASDAEAAADDEPPPETGGTPTEADCRP